MALGARLAAAVSDLTVRLENAGVVVRTEAAQVPVPGGWLELRSLDTGRATLDSPGTATANLYLVADDTGEDTALTVLTGLLDRVWPHLTDSDTDSIDLRASIALPDTGGLPAFRLPIDLEL